MANIKQTTEHEELLQMPAPPTSGPAQELSLADSGLAPGISVRRGPLPSPDPARLAAILARPGKRPAASDGASAGYVPSIFDYLMSAVLRFIERIIARLTIKPACSPPVPQKQQKRSEEQAPHGELSAEQREELKKRFRRTLHERSEYGRPKSDLAIPTPTESAKIKRID